jgi:hypothetical protein
MDIQSLGALLTALGGYFSAQAGAQAGQLQGLLLGEDLTERRKRLQMAEEAHREAIETQRLTRRLQEAEEQRRAQLFPLHERQLKTAVEAGELNLLSTRLWSLFQRGVHPSQIPDPVLRQEYEPFYNYMLAVKSLDAVQTKEDLDAVLGMVSEEQRRALEIWGRAKLFENETRRQMIERQMKGLDINLAQGEFQLRTAYLNQALNLVLTNIEQEGTNWDKRPPQQKIEAVRKWLERAGLSEFVPPNFAEMFQNVQSKDARHLAILRAQTELQLGAQLRAMREQFRANLNLQEHMFWSNLVAGAVAGGQGGGVGGFGVGDGGVAPVGFRVPPPLSFYKTTRDNQGSRLNQSLLNKYLEIPLNVAVPIREGVIRSLNELQSEAMAIYHQLDRPNASITTDQISTLVAFDAGLHLAYAQQGGMPISWDIALQMGASRVIPLLRSLDHYHANPNYKKAVEDWVRAFYANVERVRQGQAQQGQGGAPPLRGQIGGSPRPPANQGARPPANQGQNQGQNRRAQTTAPKRDATISRERYQH